MMNFTYEPTARQLCAVVFAASFGLSAAAADDSTAPVDAVVAATPVAASNCEPVRLTALQRRLLEKSKQGIDALRSYVYSTRSIYQFDLEQVENWAVQQRNKGVCGPVAAVVK